MEAPASGSPRLWRLLLRGECGASTALGWGPLEDSVEISHLWGPVDGGLLPVLQLPPLPPAAVHVGLLGILGLGAQGLLPGSSGLWRLLPMEAPASESPPFCGLLFRVTGGASTALGWGPLEDFAGIRHLCGPVGGGLLPSLQLPPFSHDAVPTCLQLPALWGK